jgi:hypothetical protein
MNMKLLYLLLLFLVYISIAFTANIDVTPSSYAIGFSSSGSSGSRKPPRRPSLISRHKGQVSYIFLIPYLELTLFEGKEELVGTWNRNYSTYSSLEDYYIALKEPSNSSRINLA